jgi:hypothetical protein
LIPSLDLDAVARHADLKPGALAEMQSCHRPAPPVRIVKLTENAFTKSRTWPSSSGSSGIRGKVDPQRHAECEVKRDAGCDCNGGRIHFPVPLRTDVGLPDHGNLGHENGSLKS